MFNDLTIFGLIEKGGVTVAVLILISVISLAIMLERAWRFHRFRAGVRALYAPLKRTAMESGIRAAQNLCEGNDSALAAVYSSGYEKRGRTRDEINEAMELSGRAELGSLERFLGVLGTIGSTAPFIGLFGTVLGIIRAFSDLAIAEGASPAAVADGIAEALVATAAGLLVAVPSVMAYNYFVRSLSRSALELEVMASEFTDLLSTEGKDGLEDKGN